MNKLYLKNHLCTFLSNKEIFFLSNALFNPKKNKHFREKIIIRSKKFRYKSCEVKN